MTGKEFVSMLIEAGFDFEGAYTVHELDDQLERFAALVAAHEREECAKMCERQDDDEFYPGWQYAEMLRERGDD